MSGALSGMGTFSRSRRRSLISIERRISSSLCMDSLLISRPRRTFSPSVHRQNWRRQNRVTFLRPCLWPGFSWFFRFLQTHVSSGGSDEIQAVLFHIIGDAEGQVQHLLQTNTARRQPAAGEHKRYLRRHDPPTLFCLPLFSFMWGQSLPVSKPLISATGTEDETVGHEKTAAQVLRLAQLSTHSSPGAFQWAGCPRRPPRRRSEAFCDWAIGGSTIVYLENNHKGF